MNLGEKFLQRLMERAENTWARSDVATASILFSEKGNPEYFNIRKAQIKIDKELFSKLNINIWEFRTLYNKTYYRLFAFWDKTERVEKLVISTHEIIKKTMKTPSKEIKKAIQIKEKYFNLKNREQ